MLGEDYIAETEDTPQKPWGSVEAEGVKQESRIQERRGCLRNISTGLVILATACGIMKDVFPMGNIFQRISKGASIAIADPLELSTYVNLNLAQLYSSHIGNMPLTAELLKQMLFSESPEINITEIYFRAIVNGYRSNGKFSGELSENQSEEEIFSNYFQTSIFTTGAENFKVENSEGIITVTMQTSSYENVDLSNALNFYGSQIKFLAEDIEKVPGEFSTTVNIRNVEFSAFDTYDWWSSVVRMEDMAVNRSLLNVYEELTGQKLGEDDSLKAILNQIVIEIKDEQVAIFVDKGLGSTFKVKVGPIKLKNLKLTFESTEQYQDFLNSIKR